MKRKKEIIYENLLVTDIGAKGVGVAKTEQGKVVLIKNGIPGDVLDVRVYKNKRRYSEAKIIDIKEKSSLRINPECTHFGVCGGCKWQNLAYSSQVTYKQNEVENNIRRIGGISDFETLPIVKCEEIYFYRNKLEFSFSDARWITENEINENKEIENKNALGFHIPGMWSKVLQIENCLLQQEPSNKIRQEVFRYANEHNFEFFNLKEQTGFIRQMMIRSNEKGDFMLLFQFIHESDAIIPFLNHLTTSFPEIKTIGYAINDGANDIWYDLDIKITEGSGFLTETMEDLNFKIYPKSFFQTNTKQAIKLYEITREFAQLTGNELVYDLYTGTGTIAQFVAKKAKKVVGIESVADAILAAKQASKENNINNCEFICGDMKTALSEELIQQYGKPEVIITDPPRDGMHPKVVKFIMNLSPKRIVYVSCNSATQGRDIEILKEKYKLIKIQAVDMFPQTHHVENIALLELKSEY